MKRFKLSPEAARDIREIWAYIAENSIEAARRVRLADFPRLPENRREPRPWTQARGPYG